MTKECIICGMPVTALSENQIVSCESYHCQTTIENCIGLHYQAGENKTVDKRGEDDITEII